MRQLTLDTTAIKIQQWKENKKEFSDMYLKKIDQSFARFCTAIVGKAELLNARLKDLHETGQLKESTLIDTSLASKGTSGGVLEFEGVQLDYKLDPLIEPPELQLTFTWPGKSESGPDLRLIADLMPVDGREYKVVWQADFSRIVFQAPDDLAEFCIEALVDRPTKLRA